MEYQCENTLPEATKGSTTTKMTGSEQCESSKSTLNEPRNVSDEINNVNNSAKELPDDTTPSKDVLLDETANRSVIQDITDPNKTTVMCYQMILSLKIKCYQTKQKTITLLTEENNN